MEERTPERMIKQLYRNITLEYNHVAKTHAANNIQAYIHPSAPSNVISSSPRPINRQTGREDGRAAAEASAIPLLAYSHLRLWSLRDHWLGDVEHLDCALRGKSVIAKYVNDEFREDGRDGTVTGSTDPPGVHVEFHDKLVLRQPVCIVVLRRLLA